MKASSTAKKPAGLCHHFWTTTPNFGRESCENTWHYNLGRIQAKQDFKGSWEMLMDTKQTGPEMLKELGQAVQQFLNRHGG